jgi:hypothetical protein
MTAPIDVVLGRLEGLKVRSNGPGRWRACCPAHGGKNPTALSIGEGQDGAVLLRCWHGCEVDEVAQALGLELSDLFPPRQTDHASPKPRRIGMLTASQCLEVIEFECSLVWTAAHNLANGHGLKPEDLTRLSVAAARIGGLIREAKA